MLTLTVIFKIIMAVGINGFILGLSVFTVSAALLFYYNGMPIPVPQLKHLSKHLPVLYPIGSNQITAQDHLTPQAATFLFWLTVITTFEHPLQLIKLLDDTKSHCVVTGDFNIDVHKINSSKVDLMSDYDFSQMITSLPELPQEEVTVLT